MDVTGAFSGLSCVDCGETFDAEAATGRCPDCGGILDPAYDYDALELSRADLDGRAFDSMWRYRELLPFDRGTAVTMDEGTTALVDCPALADEIDVDRLLIKDEGRNPTGTFKDRGASVAITAADQHGATDVALATAGNAGQAAAAYAARAGLEAHVFVPSRAPFVNKAMINVHGADMTVVGGRIDDAGAAFEAELAEHDDWHPVQTFVTPYRHEGKKTMGYEVVEQLDWEVPDAVVYPTGGGVGLVGVHKALTEFERLGLIDDLPALYAAQSAGCAPIVDAVEAGRDEHEPWETPDTVCGGLEIPDPGASRLILEAIRDTGGGAVATDDSEILEAGVGVSAGAGVEICPPSAAAASGAWELARRGEFGPDDTVVVLATGTANKEADLLRSHLMGQGV